MQKSTERIHPSHVGSLPRPDDLLEVNCSRRAGGKDNDAAFQERLSTAVREVVTRQQRLGIDIPGMVRVGIPSAETRAVDYPLPAGYGYMLQC